ncbi:MAG: transcription elongation factor GreB [Candidatus Azotimanducaceae bacterium]|jgi:transcription elongation factor GreB|tara:strand:- start:602 stop:1141 length:540 start_codon:yes stop_codon:yes gene_type:complete
MGRYRPPEAPKTAVITPAGFALLQEEMNFLWKVKRPEVTRKVSEAAAQGDRSENADYIYGKRQLAEIDRRIRYLDKRMAELQIVDRPPSRTDRVYFGAWVTLEGDSPITVKYRLVGPDEIDTKKEYISVDAPMAKLLLGKGVGDEVTIAQSTGTTRILSFADQQVLNRYEIIAIDYEQS